MMYSNDTNSDSQNDDQESEDNSESKTPEQIAAENIADAAYWIKWIKGAKKGASQHWEISAEAWREYLNEEKKAQGASDLLYRLPKRYPLFWSSVQTLQSAFYSRTPIFHVNRQFDSDNPAARLACILGENLLDNLIKLVNLDESMFNSVDEFIITEKATTRVYFNSCIDKKMESYSVTNVIGPDGTPMLYSDGLKRKVDPEELSEQGTVEQEEEFIKDRKIELCSVTFDEIIHTPYAKNWDDITAIGNYFCYTEEEFKERWPDLVDKVTFKSLNELDRDKNEYSSESKQGTTPDKFFDGWEIWNKEDLEVLWVSESYVDSVLERVPDPLHLDGFFPFAKFVIGTKPRTSLYPVPVFKQLRATIEQLHSLYNRLFNLIYGIRRRGVTDASNEALISAINNASELEIIAVQNFNSIIEKQDPSKLIWYIPIQEVSACIVELESLTQKFDADFNRFMGIPDIVQGTSNPLEGVGTQQLKGKYVTLRFATKQEKFAKLPLNSMILVMDLALEHYPDNLLLDMMGATSLSEDQKALAPSALAILKSDFQRNILLDIETSSTSSLNDEIKKAEKNEAAATAMNGLNQIAQIAQSAPDIVPASLQILVSTLRSLADGKLFEEPVEKSINSLMAKVSQPSGPPPVDYKGLELQIKKQEADTKSMKAQVDSQLASQKASIDAQYKEQQILLDQRAQALEERAQQLNEWIENALVTLKRQELILTDRERMIEERRLAENTQLESMKIAQGPQPKAQNIIVNNIPKADPPVTINPFKPTGIL